MENCNGRISVALAVYNGGKYLKELLLSLEHQECKPYELVILDDASTDNSSYIIDEFSTNSFLIRRYSNEVNLGPIATFQKLIGLCEGDYIALCDQDDIWMPQKLKLSLEAMRKLDCAQPSVIFTDLCLVNSDGNVINQSFWKQLKEDPSKFSFSDILTDNIITGCTTLFNRRMANELKSMPSCVAMHDHWIALIAFSWGIYNFVNIPTIKYRSHIDSVTTKEGNNSVINLLKDYKNRKNYLARSFTQAEAFFQLYSQHLSDDQKRDIINFTTLRKRSFFVKRGWRALRAIRRRYF